MRTFARFLALVLAASAPLAGQTPQPTQAPPMQPGQEMVLKITKEAGRKQSFAIPPLLAPGAAAMQSRVVEPFTASLRSDLEYTGLFVIADRKQDIGFRVVRFWILLFLFDRQVEFVEHCVELFLECRVF